MTGQGEWKRCGVEQRTWVLEEVVQGQQRIIVKPKDVDGKRSETFCVVLESGGFAFHGEVRTDFDWTALMPYFAHVRDTGRLFVESDGSNAMTEIRCEHQTLEDGTQRVECYINESLSWTISGRDGRLKFKGDLAASDFLEFDAYRKRFEKTGRLFDEEKPLRVGFAPAVDNNIVVVWNVGNSWRSNLSSNLGYDTLEDLLASIKFSGITESDITWLEPQRDLSEAVRLVDEIVECVHVFGTTQYDEQRDAAFKDANAATQKLRSILASDSPSSVNEDAIRADERKRQAEWLESLLPFTRTNGPAEKMIDAKIAELTGDDKCKS